MPFHPDGCEPVGLGQPRCPVNAAAPGRLDSIEDHCEHGRVLHFDRGRAESFGTDAERYDRSRPTYPAELIDQILGPAPEGVRVLDVGCGTGIAARLMAGRGADVLGVEIDPRMAEVAVRRGTRVELGAFESWESAGRRFDRVIAAQAWHWVDPVLGPVKAASILDPGGRLCAFWNIGRHPPELAAALDRLYRRLAPGTHHSSVLLGANRTGDDPARGHAQELEGMKACDELEEPLVERFRWTRRYSREEWLDQLPTHSDHAALARETLERLLCEVGAAIDAFGGSFEMGYSTLLVSATRR